MAGVTLGDYLVTEVANNLSKFSVCCPYHSFYLGDHWRKGKYPPGGYRLITRVPTAAAGEPPSLGWQNLCSYERDLGDSSHQWIAYPKDRFLRGKCLASFLWVCVAQTSCHLYLWPRQWLSALPLAFLVPRQPRVSASEMAFLEKIQVELSLGYISVLLAASSRPFTKQEVRLALRGTQIPYSTGQPSREFAERSNPLMRTTCWSQAWNGTDGCGKCLLNLKKKLPWVILFFVLSGVHCACQEQWEMTLGSEWLFP